jgi:2'-5' RNA ligase
VKFKVCLLALLFFYLSTASARDQSVTAIDIALEPDAKTVAYAQQINIALLHNYPQGFALDATHHPHITLVQCYAHTDSLEKIYAAVSEILKAPDSVIKPLTAYKFDIYPWQGHGVMVIEIKANPDLVNLQKKLQAAVAPYTDNSGTVAAFYTTADKPGINQLTLDYVSHFASKASGQYYNPHITVGVAALPFVKKLLQQPFTTFNVTPAAVTVFQLGDYGAAAIKLKTWQ